jgi:hypothetical protein
MQIPETQLKKIFYYLMIDQRVLHLWGFYFDIEHKYNLTPEGLEKKQGVIMQEIDYYEEIIIELLKVISYDDIYMVKDEYDL